MKKPAAFFVVGIILCSAVMFAQSDFPARWSSVSHHFRIDGVAHVAQIEHGAVVASPPWDPSKPLPLSLKKVEQIARKELRKLVPNDGIWEVVQFQVSRLQAPLNSPNWYYAVQFRTTVPRQEGSVTNYYENACVLVDFEGKPGFFDDN